MSDKAQAGKYAYADQARQTRRSKEHERGGMLGRIGARRARLFGLAASSIVIPIILGLGCFSAQAAAAGFQWKVKGSPLSAGSSKSFTLHAKAGTPFLFHWTEAGIGFELQATGISVSSARILGGIPGTSEFILSLEGVTVKKPAGECRVNGKNPGTITTDVMKGELVEGFYGRPDGKIDLLLSPKTGEAWTQFSVEPQPGGSCVASGSSLVPKGSILLETAPPKTEAQIDHLIFEPSGTGYEYVNSVGERKKAGLTLRNNKATLTGEAEMELTSKEVFEAF